MPPEPRRSILRTLASYGSALLGAAAGYFLRLLLGAASGGPLPPFILFYPAVMVVALLAGMGPGLCATVLCSLATWLLIMPPTGSFVLARVSDAVALLMFFSMGVFMSVVADLLRRARQRDAEFRALKESEERLERGVRERTAELEAANGELDAFAHAVSHDLRAPLRALSGFSGALREDYGSGLPEGAREFLEQITKASANMGELIEGLLRLSRGTRGQLRREEVDISAIAEHILADLRKVPPGRDVAWNVQPGLTARGDPRLIEVVLTNLLDNAWKYTTGTPAPHIRVTGETAGGVSTLSVSDNGAGFDMRHSARLFQPFQRLHRRDEFPGIGIGLATVQRIVHRHGGTISASGSPGNGATFTFSLSRGDAGRGDA
jgi:signal transduction histidine kinase